LTARASPTSPICRKPRQRSSISRRWKAAEMRRLLEVQPDGIVEYFHFDEASGEMAIEHVQDVEPILDANKERANSHDGFSPSRELREVGEIPAIIAAKWLNEL